MYIGETGRRLATRVAEHNGKDVNSRIFQHSITNGHKPVDISDFNIISECRSNTVYKRKITEALYISKFHPNLNKQCSSVPLSLFDWQLVYPSTVFRLHFTTCNTVAFPWHICKLANLYFGNLYNFSLLVSSSVLAYSFTLTMIAEIAIEILVLKLHSTNFIIF